MNVMLMSVRQRTREIGIRVAVGARQRYIQMQFLMETVLVSVVGGAAGVPVLFSIRSILAAFLCSAVTGLMPARRAFRLDPVVALAGE